MKSSRQSKNVEESYNQPSKRGSPFARAAYKASAHRFEPGGKISPFAEAAMEGAAKRDKIGVRYVQDEAYGMPHRSKPSFKQDRPNQFDKRKAEVIKSRSGVRKAN